MNIGHFTGLKNDQCAYNTYIQQSTDPLIYQLNTNAIWNENQCASYLGPRPKCMGNGAGTLVGFPVATAQYLTDVDSILSNRNVRLSECKNSNLNPINLTKLPQYNLYPCNNFLDPIATHLSDPPIKYRGAAIDRFYNLNNNPQIPIFWNFAVNTANEARDNYKFKQSQIPAYDPMVAILEQKNN